jgi:hypothetical protein
MTVFPWWKKQKIDTHRRKGNSKGLIPGSGPSAKKNVRMPSTFVVGTRRRPKLGPWYASVTA